MVWTFQGVQGLPPTSLLVQAVVEVGEHVQVNRTLVSGPPARQWCTNRASPCRLPLRTPATSLCLLVACPEHVGCPILGCCELRCSQGVWC